MRLDKYLKVSRLIKRRTVANDVADAGRIYVNGKAVKPSYAVKVGDEIEITFGNKPVKVRVLSVQAVKAGDVIEVTFGNHPIKVRVLSDVEPRTKDVAREMYEAIQE